MGGTNNIYFLIQIITAVIVVAILILAGILFLIIFKNKKNDEENNNMVDGQREKKSDEKSQGKVPIKKFMEFDDILDNMIVRKNRQQYVMVIQCKGVNYDLLSEEEKMAVENGFTQFLNTLRFPVQLYVQTRSLNLRDIIESYREKVKEIEQDIENIDVKLKKAKLTGNKDIIEKLEFERRRKNNVLEYGTDISEYVARMSLNRTVLQQNTYVIVSYYTSELGTEVSNYSKHEIDNMCFNELYTRTQTVIRSLGAAEVSGRILESEELAELLYIAYNRDDAEILQLRRALDAEYDAFYSTAPDIMQKKIGKLQQEIEEKAVKLATQSMVEADRIRNLERNKEQKIKNRALEVVEAYKDQMDAELYNGTKEQINKHGKEEKAKEVTNSVNKGTVNKKNKTANLVNKKNSIDRELKGSNLDEQLNELHQEGVEKIKRGRKKKEA